MDVSSLVIIVVGVGAALVFFDFVVRVFVDALLFLDI